MNDELSLYRAVAHARELAGKGWPLSDAAHEAVRDTGLEYHEVRAFAGLAHAECQTAKQEERSHD